MKLFIQHAGGHDEAAPGYKLLAGISGFPEAWGSTAQPAGTSAPTRGL